MDRMTKKAIDEGVLAALVAVKDSRTQRQVAEFCGLSNRDAGWSLARLLRQALVSECDGRWIAVATLDLVHDSECGKALGCYGCGGEFATSDELTAHEQATGHGEHQEFAADSLEALEDDEDNPPTTRGTIRGLPIR